MSIPRTIGWGVALATATALISGVSVFANGLVIGEFDDPVVLTGVRNAVVGAVLLAVLLASGGRREVRALPRRTAGALTVIAVVGGSVPFILFFSGLAEASGPGAALIHKTLFVWVAVLAVPFLGESLGLAQVAALGVLLAGTLLVGPAGELGAGPGELMILAATLLWAVEVVIARRLLARDRVSVRLATTARMALGALLILAFLAVTGRAEGIVALTSWQWLLVVATGVLLLGYVTTWYAALQRAPASLVASILVGGAVVTAVLAIARTGTIPAPDVETGLALLAVGVAMAIVVGARRPLAWSPAVAVTRSDDVPG
jgi:drug/metabolite transporter (DMT)-like permease